VVTVVSQERFDAVTGYQAVDAVSGEPFTTYWHFLSAVAKVPAFCNGVVGGMYSRFKAEAMCAREVAGLAALIITQTNGWDEELVDEDSNPVELWQQGLKVLEDADCDASDELLGDYCLYFDDPDARDPFFDDKDLDPLGVGLVPRGAGYIYGADMYYWFSQVVYGDDSLTQDPTLVATDPLTWWMSGLMRWMIPMMGKPAPHNIMLGQWAATADESDVGLTDGFGAVAALFYGADQCGMAQHPVANLRSDVYK